MSTPTRITRLTVLPFLLACLPQLLTAQAEKVAERATNTIAGYFVEAADEHGSFKAPYHEATSLTDFAQVVWRIYTGLPTDPTVTAPLPFHAVGSMQIVGERRFIVGGFRYISLDPAVGYGVICRIRAEPGVGMVIDEEKAIGLDPRRLLWHDEQGHLYLHDLEREEVWAASWLGWPAVDSTPNLPEWTDFQLVADSTGIVDILDDPRTDIYKEGTGVLITTGGVDRLLPTQEYYAIPFGGSWAIAVATPVGVQPQWQVANPNTVTTDGVLTVVLDASGDKDFEVIKLLTGTSVASGTIPNGDASLSIPTPTIFSEEPGTPFQVTGAVGLPSSILFPLDRIGIPFAASTIGSIERVWVPASAAILNSNQFGASSRLHLAQDPDGVPVQITAYVALAFRDPVTGEDPKIPLGGGAYLLDTETISAIQPVPAEILKQDQPVAKKFWIPPDPHLVGSIALWQIGVVFPDQSFAVSDIAGHLIWPEGQQFSGGGGGAAAAQGGSGGDAETLEVKTARRAAQEAWMSRLVEEKRFSSSSALRELIKKALGR